MKIDDTTCLEWELIKVVFREEGGEGREILGAKAKPPFSIRHFAYGTPNKSARGQCISLFNFSSPIFNHSHNLNDMRTTSTLSRAIKTTPILITLARQTRWEGPRKRHDTNWLWASTSEISCNSTFWKENRKNLTGIGSLASGSNHYSCLQESRYYPWSYVSSAKLRSILINFWRKYFLYSSEIYGYRC